VEDRAVIDVADAAIAQQITVLELVAMLAPLLAGLALLALGVRPAGTPL
jgi:hypothetical protein